MSVAELNGMMGKLGVSESSHVLEVGSGAGGTSVYIAQNFGCQVTGVDLNPHGAFPTQATISIFTHRFFFGT